MNLLQFRFVFKLTKLKMFNSYLEFIKLLGKEFSNRLQCCQYQIPECLEIQPITRDI